MNNILTQNTGNNLLGIGSTDINILGITDNTLDITQGTTSFMSISNSSSSGKISVKKPTTLNNNLLTIKSTAKIDNATTNSLFYIDDNSELKTLGIGTTNEYLRMGFNRPAWGPKTFVETNITEDSIGNIGYLEELKIDDDKLIGIGSILGVTDSSTSNIIKYDTNNDASLIMFNGVGVGIGTLTIKTKYDTNFFDITLKKIDSDFSSNPITKSLQIVDAKTYKYTINDLGNNSTHYYKLDIDYINSSVTPSPTKKFHHITLHRINPLSITSVDWTLVNTSSANPTSSSSSYADPNYNDGATWIIGGYQGEGHSPWHAFFDEDATSGIPSGHDVAYSNSIVENRKSWSLFEHTSNANAFTNGYYTLSRVYERTGLDHYPGGPTNDPSHGLKLRFNTTVGGDSNTGGAGNNSHADDGYPWGIFCKYGFSPSSGSNEYTLATRGGDESGYPTSHTPSKIIMDFNKYIALTAFEWPTYQYDGHGRHTRLYYWNESLSTPAWTEILHFHSAFYGPGSVYFRKNTTGSDAGAVGTHYTLNSSHNNGKNVNDGFSGTYESHIPREPLIRLRFPTSYSSNSGYVRNFVRQATYARYYKIEQYGSTSENAGVAYYTKIKAIIPSQPALF